MTQWDWYRTGLRHNGTDTGWDCNTMEVIDLQDKTSTGWNCDTVVLVKGGTAIRWDWYKMELRYNGTCVQWDCDIMGLVQGLTAAQ